MCRLNDRPSAAEFTALLQRETEPNVNALEGMALQWAARSAGQATPAASPQAQDKGSSRRRRLWELPRNAFCPVLGSCLTIERLRQLIEKMLRGPVPGDDYELHSSAVAECAQRGPIAERLQRELDERYALAIQQGRRRRHRDELAQHWSGAKAEGAEVGAALWVTLTHPRCDEALQEQVLKDIHMLQHQIGSGVRVDVGRMQALVKENGVLSRALASVQERVTRLMAEKSAQIERQQAELVRLRAEVIARDSLVDQLRGDLRDLDERVPTLRSRVELGRRLEDQQSRIHDLERRLLQTEQRAVHWEERWHAQQMLQAAEGPVSDGAEEGPVLGDGQPAGGAQALRDKAILCVGGRAASVPVYRRLVETCGARFLHHDGGEEEGTGPLEASLAAADLVICQAGCISHGAYWRVKDHCKRTGKRCVFVDRPSASSLARGLDALGGACAPTWMPMQGPRSLSDKTTQ